ncbi:MAG: ice-binding family protein [Flavitalea sp.]
MKTNLNPKVGILPQSKYWQLFTNKWFVLSLLIVFAAGCKKIVEENGQTGLCPIVVSVNPANGATDIDLDADIKATFNELMNFSTINTSTFTITDGTSNVPGVITHSGMEVIFTPSDDFLPNTTYTAKIVAGVKDPAGNAMIEDYVWTFKTGAAPDIIIPSVVSVAPSNGELGVSLKTSVTAIFSEIMDSSTINASTFTLTQGTTIITGNLSYSGTTLTFVPSADLVHNTVYKGTITTGAKDLAGNSLQADFVWNFRTEQAAVPAPTITGELFGVFGGSAGITNQGLNTVINNGSIGTTGASTLITGFHEENGPIYTETDLNVGLVKGKIYTAPPAPGDETSFAIAQKGLADATALYLSISPASKPGGIDPGAGELGGLTLAPGIYKSESGTFKITNGDLTLDAKGNPDAVWIFQTAAGLTVGIAGPVGARSVKMINGALPKNVYWHVGSAATINGAGGGVMVGNIIASAGVTFSTPGNATQTVLDGRAISLNASVTLVNTTINVPE